MSASQDWKNSPVIAGADEDCKDLIDAFCARPSVRFKEFVHVWNERKFDSIYFGRESFIDLLEFTEGLLAIAKAFCLPPNDPHVMVGGVYLLYSLYYVQPTKEDGVPYVKIRVIMEEWDSLETLKEKCKKDEQLEVVYMLSKMLCDGAFHFTATQWPYCVSKAYRQYVSKESSQVHDPDLVAIKDGKCVTELQEAYEVYARLKQKLSDEDSSASAALADYSETNFAEVLKSTVESFGKHGIKPN